MTGTGRMCGRCTPWVSASDVPSPTQPRSHQYSVAVVGTGFAAQHLDWLSRCPDARVDWLVFRRDGARAAALARDHSIPRTTSVLNEALSAGPDVVAVVTPPASHLALAEDAFAAGSAVVCDKPLGRSTAEAAVLARRVADSGLLGVVMFQWRFDPALRALRDLLRAGGLGSVLHVELSFRHDFLCGPRTAWPWRHDAGQAGAGAFADLGVHLLDLARWLTGSEFVVSAASGAVTWPERITFGSGLPGGTEDVGVALLASRTDGYDVSLMVSRAAPGRRALRVDITGSVASALVEIEPDAGPSVLTRWPDRTERRWGREAAGNPYDAVLARLDGRAVPDLPDFEDGLAAQRLLDRLVR